MKPAAFILGVLAVAASSAAAEEPVPELQLQPPDYGAAVDMLDQPHEYLSHRVEEFSRYLDTFYGDPNRVYDSTGSTLQIRDHLTFFKGGRRESQTEVRAHVSLPNTEDRLKFVVQRGVTAATQTSAERDIKNVTGSDQVTAQGAQQDNSYYLGLKALAAEILGVKLSGEAGAKFGTPLNTYVRLRASRDFIVSNWAIRLSETPLWKHSEGTSAATEASFDRPLGQEWLFRFTTKATWRDTTGYSDLAQIGSLYFTPDKRTAYTFELGAFGPSEPSAKPTVYAITLRARKLIYRDWLYLELTPQILYPKTDGFRPMPSIMLQLEALFGDRYLQR
jgi:hypothetical protein